MCWCDGRCCTRARAGGFDVPRAFTQDPEGLADAESTYQLMGVVVHAGTSADEGHYYSVIRERADNGVWYRFDDAEVGLFDENQMSAFFGGTGSRAHAYILVYERRFDSLE